MVSQNQQQRIKLIHRTRTNVDNNIPTKKCTQDERNHSHAANGKKVNIIRVGGQRTRTNIDKVMDHRYANLKHALAMARVNIAVIIAVDKCHIKGKFNINIEVE